MSRRSRVGTTLAIATACTTGLLAFQPAFATGGPSSPRSTTHTSSPSGKGHSADKAEQQSTIDVRQGTSRAARKANTRKSALLQARPAVRELSQQLGTQSVIDIDPLTGTPRQVSRLDGLLTGPSASSAASIALSYVRDHAAVFKLSTSDLDHLELARDYVDIAGIRHLSFVQKVDGVPLFGNGLKANVTKDGRLINVTGSPVAGLHSPASVRGGLSVNEAIRAAKKDVGEADVAPAKGDSGKEVLFQTPGGTRRAIQTVTMSASQPTLAVIDAESGRVLYRDFLSSDLVDSAVGQARTEVPAKNGPNTRKAAKQVRAKKQVARVFDWYPGAPGSGGKTHRVNLNKRGWLPRGSVVLFGNNVHSYSDVNDNNVADSGEEIAPTGRKGYIFPLVRTSPPKDVDRCATWACTWLPETPFSWQDNESRTAVQNFYFVNTWHDYLEKAPIGFTEAAGNFQQVNSSGQGKGGDSVHNESLDGADTAAGLPDLRHIDNANFATPPDGISPTMQMYLWSAPHYIDQFIPTMGSDEADIVYHEYTHGLSHRLVTDANNNPALDSHQGGSMGEAWSDWYALDYLVNQGHIKDRKGAGDIQTGYYVGAGKGIRSEATDCKVGSTSPACPGIESTGPGGYTYGDFEALYTDGRVHRAGEIWTQSLWDLRTAVGPKLAESLVTRAMELSPTYPSYLDMRNSILQADEAIYGGQHVKKVWKVFAHRGMGFFAGTVDGNDLHPVEDFNTPPAADTPRGTVTGTVTDQSTDDPVAGATVAFGGHNSGFPGDYAATTAADGTYTIEGIIPGTYPDVFVGGAGYDSQVTTLSVGRGSTTKDWSLVRDWAASAGGATVTDFTGPDYTPYGCGPSSIIDQSLGQGWGSDAADGGQYVVIKLPQAVDISTVAIDPSNTCGDGPEAATAGYTVETSPDGTTWTMAAQGTFGADNLGKLNSVTPTAGAAGVQYVKYTMLDPQGGPGVQFLDSSEIEVYGAPSGG
ncbi:M36 family metallopeptidase [Segeticoccus rhizosphaerae]|uniref:M36 family metallopeptidase n=1 Tax=Segeticoccus rhizosphaerae TaxID=1104777 RepID=UPI0010C0658F|nr:M36 family metallopeptidase [Ornithinicoccus soli]